MAETFYIGESTYRIRFREGIHQVVRDNRVVFEGWYEKCRAFVREAEIAYREALVG